VVIWVLHLSSHIIVVAFWIEVIPALMAWSSAQKTQPSTGEVGRESVEYKGTQNASTHSKIINAAADIKSLQSLLNRIIRPKQLPTLSS
jgi:hypothetical protein